MKIVIIGNSAASTAAVEAIREHDPKSSIIQISNENHALYSRCLLPFYLAGEIDKTGLSYRNRDFHKKANVNLHIGLNVIRVDPDRQQVFCQDRRLFGYDRLLIATGSSAKIPENVPIHINGVFALRTLEDAEKIKKRIPRTKNAVILGGGLIGLKAAYALNKCGLNVTVVVRSSHILSQMIDNMSAQIIKKRMEERGIEILVQSDILEANSKNNSLVSVKTDKGQTLACELLIAAKGTLPNTNLIKHTGLAVKHGIKTNPYMQTNYENIFAAGDVAEAYDISTEDYAINALWTCAVQQGRVAGLNICEKQKKYEGTLGMNSLNIFGFPVISFGLTSPKDDSLYEVFIDKREEKNEYKKIVIKDNRIKGIILVGKIDNAGVLLSLIKNRTNVSGLKDELLDDHFNFARLIKYGRKSAFKKYYGGNISNIIN